MSQSEAYWLHRPGKSVFRLFVYQGSSRHRWWIRWAAPSRQRGRLEPCCTASLHDKTCRKKAPRDARLSQDAVQAKRLRRRCEKRWRKTSCEADRTAYRKACRNANRLIIASEKSRIEEKFEFAGNDQKEVWRISNGLLHRNKPQISVEDPDSLCSDFKTFSIEKLRTICSKIVVELTRYGSFLVDLRPRVTDVLEDFERTTPDEIAKVINRLKCKNSPTDIIPTTVLKRCVNVFSVALFYLINLSFESKTFPSVFKVGHVIPLLKKPDMDINDSANHRPITNLKTISKVVERIAFSHLQYHMHQSKNFITYQSAYRSGYSTETALLKVTDDLNASMDSKSCSILLSLDISAAFDMIDIDILLPRLESEFGIIGSVALWIRSYLTDRECYVVCWRIEVGCVEVSWRRPARQCVGTVYFLRLRVPHCANLRPFWHTVSSVCWRHVALHNRPVSSRPDTADKLCRGSDALVPCQWLVAEREQDRGNRVQNQTTARQTYTDANGRIAIGGTEIVVSDHIKILGVHLDSTLSMNVQVAATAKACNFHIRALRHIRPLLTKRVAQTISYGMAWWQLGWITATRCCRGTSKDNIARLQCVQNSLARVVLRAPWKTPSKPHAQGVALAFSATTCDLQDQSSGVQDLAEQETSVSALLTDSLRTSSMLAIEGTFLVDQESCQYGSSLASVQAFRAWNLEQTDFEYSSCSFTQYF